jgi:hypothetical protein
MRFSFLFTVFFLSIFGFLNGPSKTNSGVNPLLYQKYRSSLDYLASFKIDSAEAILDSILLDIQRTNIEDTPFGLRVKSRKAEALERDNEGDLALIAFHEVKEKALQLEVWDVYAYASINLALIYEKIENTMIVYKT